MADGVVGKPEVLAADRQVANVERVAELLTLDGATDPHDLADCRARVIVAGDHRGVRGAHWGGSSTGGRAKGDAQHEEGGVVHATLQCGPAWATAASPGL